MTSDSSAAATSGQPFGGLIQLAGIGEQAYATYTAGQVSKKAISGLTPQTLTYVILGLGALGVVALFVFKH